MKNNCMAITITNKGSYSEEGQPNPMRWMLLSQITSGTYQNESAWLKCKDFFNDLAYTMQTDKSFEIYSFDAGKMKASFENSDDCINMLLDVLTPTFIHNLEIINKWLDDRQNLPHIYWEKQDKGKVFITFDPIYFKNTYNISLISLIIRLCNYDNMVFNTFKDLEDCKKFPHGDQWKWDTVVKKGIYFNLPVALQKYVWYEDATHNSETIKDGYMIPQLVHNNGVVAWTKAMEKL